MSGLIIHNLIKTYKGALTNALNGVSITVESGEFFGLLGPNGSGKTTLVSILCGLRSATEGTLAIAGYSIPKQLNKIKPLIGLVPQELALYPTLTFQENLMYFGKLYGLKGKKLATKIDECIALACLEKFANKKIEQYSGGMKRRANLAVGVLHEPSLLFLDEPTVNVDPQSKEVIFKCLEALNQQGMTMIYTTHQLEEAERLCSRLVIIDDGNVITEGSPQGLIDENPDCKDLGQVFMKFTGHALRD